MCTPPQSTRSTAAREEQGGEGGVLVADAHQHAEECGEAHRDAQRAGRGHR